MPTIVPYVVGKFWNDTPDGFVPLLIAAVAAVGLCRLAYLGPCALHYGNAMSVGLEPQVDILSCSVFFSAVKNTRTQTCG